MKSKLIRAILSALLFFLFFSITALGAIPAAPVSLHTAKAQTTRPSPVSEPPQIPTQGTYACILYESFFYSAPNDNSGLFLLPKTYYVRLLEYGMEYCKIEYLTEDAYTKRLVGYAKTSELTFVDYVPKRPYLYHYFEVTYRIEDVEKPNSAFLDQIVMTCAYYGDYKVGSKTYCYVLRDTQLGYVTKPASLYYEENTEYAEYLEHLQASASAPNEEELQNPQKSSVPPLHVAILIALCLLVPLLAALILKPPRRPPYETDA